MYIVIAGGGKIASELARTLTEKDHTVVIVERREEVADRLAKELHGKPALIILGDGTDVKSLDEAGVGRADIFVSATGEDEDNLVACQLALSSYGVPRALSRVNSPKNLRIFRELGIEGISSTEIISRMIEEEATIGHLHTLRVLTKGNLDIVEIELTPEETDINHDGVRIGDLALPSEIKLIAVVRGEDDDAHLALADTQLFIGDSVIALATPETKDILTEVLRKAPPMRGRRENQVKDEWREG